MEPPFAVDIEKGMWQAFVRGASSAVVRRAERVRDEFLKVSPEDRMAPMARGKLKKLKGRQAGILQFDLSDSHRLWYRVDRVARRVQVEYIGDHP